LTVPHARLKAVFALLVVAEALLVVARPAGAAPGDALPAEVRFEIGDYDHARHDWQVTAVVVSGGLLEGKRAAVSLLDAGGTTLWEGEADFHAPSTRIGIDRTVMVGAVATVSLAQQGFSVQSTPAAVVATPASVPSAELEPLPARMPDVIVLPPERFTQRGIAVTADQATAPRLVVTLIVLLVVFVLVFRLPLLPIGAQARWRR
jgi:hypothetical protein